VSTYKSVNIQQLYGIRIFPSSILINKEGKVHKIMYGWGKDAKEKLEREIQEML